MRSASRRSRTRVTNGPRARQRRAQRTRTHTRTHFSNKLALAAGEAATE